MHEDTPTEDEMIADLNDDGWDHRHPVFGGKPLHQVYADWQAKHADDLRIGVEIDRVIVAEEATLHVLPAPTMHTVTLRFGLEALDEEDIRGIVADNVMGDVCNYTLTVDEPDPYVAPLVFFADHDPDCPLIDCDGCVSTGKTE